MNWMILTKMLRGVSLGTTLREPLGKSAETMLSSRLGGKTGTSISTLSSKQSPYLYNFYMMAMDCRRFGIVCA